MKINYMNCTIELTKTEMKAFSGFFRRRIETSENSV